VAGNKCALPVFTQGMLSTGTGILFASSIELAAGNLFSIHSPARDRAVRFWTATGIADNRPASFGIRGGFSPGAVLMLWLSRQNRNLDCRTTRNIILPCLCSPV
jgi:hypothetical protein